MSGHTPGPWRTVTPVKARGDDALDTGIFTIIDGEKRLVAECFGRTGQDVYFDSLANARHIAKAVNHHDELVAVARALLAFADGPFWATGDKAVAKARDVMKKLKGES